MAGDWIKWTKGLTLKPEVIRMAELLDKDRHEIAGRLMVLWEWADSNVTFLSRSDRDTCDATVSLGARAAAHINAIVGLDGFAGAMAVVGWLRLEQGEMIFPNLSRHNGQTSKERALAMSRKRLSRVSNGRQAGGTVSRSDRDICHGKSVTREEKRREEYIGLSSGESCGDLSETGSPPPVVVAEAQGVSHQRPEERPTVPEEPGVLTFPCVGKGPGEWVLTAAKLAEYRAAFPGIDVEAQCRAALQWCRDNRAKRKTATGMASFLTRWLTKAQNDGRPQARLSGGGFAAARGIIRVDNEADYGPAPP